MARITISIAAAPKIREWIRDRGGVNCWTSANLSDPGRECLTPFLTSDGKETGKPEWWCANDPDLYKTEDAFEVVTEAPFKTCRIAIRVGAGGLLLKLTDASSDKVKRLLTEAGEGSRYEFGGDDGKDCTIYKKVGATPLEGWNA